MGKFSVNAHVRGEQHEGLSALWRTNHHDRGRVPKWLEPAILRVKFQRFRIAGLREQRAVQCNAQLRADHFTEGPMWTLQ